MCSITLAGVCLNLLEGRYSAPSQQLICFKKVRINVRALGLYVFVLGGNPYFTDICSFSNFSDGLLV